ncbi:MurR/RpiR family transcriptional regulator [Lactiplantibacillus fabifermentans]|nr:MurR/RpiR family transcriptional regulator [Lactiplantibacillus fabifermentans]ETY73155.1 RpiR family transcriptional regulator [Lactiplantibacillus fabifermentans T30PCM01]
MSIIQKVEAQYPDLSRQERKVALRVMQAPEQVQQMTISSLAKAVKVSNATVTRFVKKIGCRDFYSFKIALSQPAEPQAPIAATTNQNTTADEVYDFYSKVLSGTQERLDMDKITATAKAISSARRVYLFGLGSSGYTANEMTQRLLRMEIAAFCMTDTHIMFITSSIITADDIVIAISLSGKTTDINESVAIAKEKGAKIIAITAFENSKLAEISDITVLVKNSSFIDNTRFINSQFAITYALDIITTVLLKNDDYRHNMDQTIEMITNRKLEK